MAYPVTRTSALPTQCACCLTPTENKVKLSASKGVGAGPTHGTRRVVEYWADVPQCAPCARRYANLGRYRAAVFLAALIAGYVVTVNSKYRHGSDGALLAALLVTVAAASLLAFLVGFLPTYRRAGHASRCRAGWIDTDGKLWLTNEEYARRVSGGAPPR